MFFMPMKIRNYVSPVLETLEIQTERLFVGSDETGNGSLEDMNRDEWGGSWTEEN